MIKFETVSKVFPPGETVIDQANFEIEPQEFVIIQGPSGSGKTTLLRLIYREIEPTSGKITINNQDTARFKEKDLVKLRREVGYAFQDNKIIPDLTVAENIALVLEILNLDQKLITERIEHLLELVGLTGKSRLFPGQLSGGELQRVGIARAIAAEPKILMADEPTGNLDLSTSLTIADLLKQINQLGTTVILATHDHDVINHLDTRQIVLDKGKIVKDTSKLKSATGRSASGRKKADEKS